jgi:hypothetical protein
MKYIKIVIFCQYITAKYNSYSIFIIVFLEMFSKEEKFNQLMATAIIFGFKIYSIEQVEQFDFKCI